MKKIFLFILCFLFIMPNFSFAFSQQELKDFETTLKNDKQIILREFIKENKSLTQEELTKALSRTRYELLLLLRTERKYSVKTDHICYPNGVIKRTTIISSDGNITYHYFNIYGIEVGSLTYKNNKLVASSKPISNEKVQSKTVLIQDNTSLNDKNSNDDSKDTSNNWISSIGNASVSNYSNGRISSIGNMSVSYYSNGRISSIGNMSVSYYSNGRISSIGNMSVSYHSNGQISSIGNMSVSYSNGRISRIGDMYVRY